jgi:ferredoxin--NADP+ reductase
MQNKGFYMINYITVVIKAIKDEAFDTRSFFFDIPNGMTWSAGTQIHFAHTDFMDSGTPDKAMLRHMSLMTLPQEGTLAFTTRVPGSKSKFKERLATLVPGDKLVMFKSDNRLPLRRENRPIIFISMGVGVATFRPMIFEWVKNSTGIPTITNLIVDKKDQFLFRREFESISQSNLTHIFCENRNSFYTKVELLPFATNPIFYIVGSDNFLENVIEQLKNKEIRPEDIELDKKPDKKALMLGR